MQPLFETDSAWTFEEYRDFCRVINAPALKKQRRTFIILSALMFAIGVVFVALPYLSTLCGVLLMAYAVVICAAYFIIMPKRLDKGAEKVWESDNIIKSEAVHFSFFEDHLIQAAPGNTREVKYADLYDIIETDNSFYIMLNKVMGMNIRKSQASPELAEFIRNLKKS